MVPAAPSGWCGRSSVGRFQASRGACACMQRRAGVLEAQMDKERDEELAAVAQRVTQEQEALVRHPPDLDVKMEIVMA